MEKNGERAAPHAGGPLGEREVECVARRGHQPEPVERRVQGARGVHYPPGVYVEPAQFVDRAFEGLRRLGEGVRAEARERRRIPPPHTPL